MFAFANKSHLFFEPAASLAFAVDTPGNDIYETPEGLELQLGDLARLQYLTATLRYDVRLSGADSAGKVLISVRRGLDVLSQKTVTFSGVDRYSGSFSVAVGDVVGADQLMVAVDVLEAAGSDVTATIAAVLEVESPLVIGV